MRAGRVLPGTWRRQRLAAWSTKLLLVLRRRARAVANRLGQFQPSVPLLTSRMTRCGLAGSLSRLKASTSAVEECVVLAMMAVGVRWGWRRARSTSGWRWKYGVPVVLTTAITFVAAAR